MFGNFRALAATVPMRAVVVLASSYVSSPSSCSPSPQIPSTMVQQLHPYNDGAGKMAPMARSQVPMNPGSPTSSASSPMFRFGVIADIQYCDIEDGYNYARTQKRHYRGSLEMISAATTYWRERNVKFVCQMGDIIDGQCRSSNKGPGGSTSETALASVLAALREAGNGVDFVHLIGNHELYNFNRDDLDSRLGTRSPVTGKEYHVVRPCDGWRLVVLDPYHDAVIGAEPLPAGDGRWERAFDLLKQRNKNIQDPEALKGGNWFKDLAKEDKNFVPFNGGLGEVQRAWLDKELADADACGDRVVLLTHVALHPSACDGTTMVWDYEQVLQMLDEHECVGAVLSGHDHSGGYHQQVRREKNLASRGTGNGRKLKGDAEAVGRKETRSFGGSVVHHITLQSPLNRGARGRCFGCVDLFEDAIVIRGPKLSHILSDGRKGDTTAPSFGGIGKRLHALLHQRQRDKVSDPSSDQKRDEEQASSISDNAFLTSTDESKIHDIFTYVHDAEDKDECVYLNLSQSPSRKPNKLIRGAAVVW
jgi:manganese-dependent ADP-ribose/CDP-alcohol diphosphatase